MKDQEYNTERIGLFLKAEREKQKLAINALAAKSDNIEEDILKQIEADTYKGAFFYVHVHAIAGALGINGMGFMYEANQQTLQQRRLYVFGLVLKEEREKRKLSVEQLSKLTNHAASVQNIIDIEDNKGNTTDNALNMMFMAAAMKLSFEYLIFTVEQYILNRSAYL